MKNINVKKVVAGAAALALGVGVLGVAIAGNNSGDTFGPVVKGDVYTPSTMQPKVSIVTGVAGDDEQWALNIANAIATSAKKRNPEYDAWVPSGGSTTVTGDGKEFKKIKINDPTTFDALKLDYKDYPSLGDYKVKVNNTEFGTTEIKVKDFLYVSGNVAFDPDEDVKDLTTTIESQQLEYQVTFTPGIKDGADDTGSPDFKFNIMGKEYTLESWNGTAKELILVQNKATTPYVEGDSFTAGNYTIEVVDILDSGANNEFEVELRLKNASGTVVSTDIFSAQEEIFSDYLDVTVEISKVYSDKVAIIAGTSAKLTLNDGDLIEDFPTSGDELWAVDMEVDGDKALTSITIYNDDPDVEWKNEEALRIGDAASYPFDFAKVKFEGLTEEDSKTVSVEDGYINYTDADDEDHEIFFYDYASWSNGVERYTTRKTIDDKKLYFDFNTTSGKFTIQETNSDGEYLDHDGSWGTLHEYDIPDNNTIDFNVGLWNNEDELVTYTLFTDSNTSIKKIAVGLNKGATGTINDLDNDHTWEIGDIYDNVDVNNQKTGIMIGDNDDGFATAALKSMFEFIVVDSDGNFAAHIDAYTGNLVNTSSTKYKAGLVQVTSTDFFDLDQEETDDLRWAYTDWGTKYEVDGGKFTATIPESQLYAKIFIGEGTTVIDDSDETNPYPKYITTNIVANDLLKKDTPMEVSGTLIVVGGHLVNKSAEGITENFLVEEADHIMGKHTNGNIYVAGWTKADTGRAASELVNVITSWPIE